MAVALSVIAHNGADIGRGMMLDEAALVPKVLMTCDFVIPSSTGKDARRRFSVDLHIP
jgi:hypothetical protein